MWCIISGMEMEHLSTKKVSKRDSYSRIADLTRYVENPFIIDIDPHMRRRTEILYDGKQAVVNIETGEVEDASLHIARIKWVEAEQFVKVYTANVSVFFELSRPAQRVCEFLVFVLSERESIGTDRVFLYDDDYLEFWNERGGIGASKQTFNRGMRELAAKALIAKANRPHQWFINPAVIFNGDRARFITEVRKKKKSKAAELEDHGQMVLPDLSRIEDEKATHG